MDRRWVACRHAAMWCDAPRRNSRCGASCHNEQRKACRHACVSRRVGIFPRWRPRLGCAPFERGLVAAVFQCPAGQAISAPKGRGSPSPGQRPGELCRDTIPIGPTGPRFSLQSQPQTTQIVYQRKRSGWRALRNQRPGKAASHALRCAQGRATLRRISALAYDDPGRCRRQAKACHRDELESRLQPAKAGTPACMYAYPQFRRVKAYHPAACLAAAFAAWLAASAAAFAEGPILLRDVTKQTGIGFRHTDGSSGRRYIVEFVASGLATFDYDNDGLIDIYFLNGRPLPGAKADLSAKNHLCRNLGGFRFEDVTEKAGVGGAGYGLGVCVGDYDNDGHADIYVNNFGPNVLYRNNGDGTFTDVTARAGVGRGQKVGAGCSFLDIDGDGNLDLFVANYIKFTCEMHVPKVVARRARLPRPPRLSLRHEQSLPQQRRRYVHRGEPRIGNRGTCRERHGDRLCRLRQRWQHGRLRTQRHLQELLVPQRRDRQVHGSGVDQRRRLQRLWAGDGEHGRRCGRLRQRWLAGFLLHDVPERVADPVARPGQRVARGCDAEDRRGARRRKQRQVGLALVDFDNDGFKDIFLGMGNIDDNIELRDDTTTYEARPVLLRNLGNGRFANVSRSSGDGVQVKTVARGIAFDDLDNDGRVDVVILSSRRPPLVLRNESATGNHWLQVRLRGVKTNRDGVGARVRLTAGDLSQIDEVHSGRGYQSHFGSRLHFGLGKRTRVDRVEVRWIGGGADVFENLEADRLVTLTEGSGVP